MTQVHQCLHPGPGLLQCDSVRVGDLLHQGSAAEEGRLSQEHHLITTDQCPQVSSVRPQTSHHPHQTRLATTTGTNYQQIVTSLTNQNSD